MRMAIVLSMALASGASHAERPPDYAFGLAIEAPPGIAYARVPLPAAVYEGTAHRNLADMRVFNADGEVVPFAFVPRTVESVPLAEVPLPMFALHVAREGGDLDNLALSVVRNAGSTSINVTARDASPPEQERTLAGYVLDASEREEPVVALTFALPPSSAATSMRLRIDASDDLVHWRSVRPDGTLVLLEQSGQRLVRDRIEVPSTKAKYLRVSWTPGRPVIAFTGVTGEFGSRPVEPAREWRTATGSAIAEREGEYQYDLGGAFPVDRIAVELAAANSIVPATIFARDAAAEPWLPVGSTVFYRIAQPAAESVGGAGGVVTPASDATSPPFTLDGRPHRYWMLRLDPRAGVTGANAPVLRAGWQVQEIVFAARGNAPFVLAFGRLDAKPGALPIETLIPDYATRRALPAGVVLARTGARTDLGGAARLEKPADTKRWVLWGVLVLGALVLGWMAWRLSRDMSATPSAAADEGEPRRE